MLQELVKFGDHSKNDLIYEHIFSTPTISLRKYKMYGDRSVEFVCGYWSFILKVSSSQ